MKISLLLYSLQFVAGLNGNSGKKGGQGNTNLILYYQGLVNAKVRRPKGEHLVSFLRLA